MIDLTNKRFGRLNVVELSKKRGNAGQLLWYCICDCGKTTIVQGAHLRSGHTKSCGCLDIDRKTKHGKVSHKLYWVWCDMKSRCLNHKHLSFDKYGGRGISVCEEWLNDPNEFIEWGLKNGWASGLHIDRIDNDKGYCPDNCRFVTQAENNQNRRLLYANNKTGFVGVFKRGNKYMAYTQYQGIKVHLGTFGNKIDAAKARDAFLISKNINRKLNFTTKDWNDAKREEFNMRKSYKFGDE